MSLTALLGGLYLDTTTTVMMLPASRVYQGDKLSLFRAGTSFQVRAEATQEACSICVCDELLSGQKVLFFFMRLYSNAALEHYICFPRSRVLSGAVYLK